MLFRDPAAEASFDEKIQAYKNSLYPVLLVENLPPGCVHKAVVHNGGTGLLALENTVAVRSLLKARKKGRADFEAKTRAFQNRTREGGLLEENQGPTLVRPAISCLMRCDAQTLASLLCSPDPVLRQFADQLMICSPEDSGISLGCGTARVPDSWGALIAELFLRRGATNPRHLTLSPEGAALLLAYARECGRQYEAGRLLRLAPVFAGKTALILQASTTDSPDEISVSTVATAIESARRNVRDTDAAANQLFF